MVKKLPFMLFLVALCLPLVTPNSIAETSYNFLTKGFADTLYCQQNGICNLTSLNVNNVTAYNVTGVVNAYGYNINGTSIFNLIPQKNVSGLVARINRNGTTTYYSTNTNTDAARGATLTIASNAVIDSDTLKLSCGDYATDGLSFNTNVSIIGSGPCTYIYDIGFAGAGIAISFNDGFEYGTFKDYRLSAFVPMIFGVTRNTTTYFSNVRFERYRKAGYEGYPIDDGIYMNNLDKNADIFIDNMYVETGYDCIIMNQGVLEAHDYTCLVTNEAFGGSDQSGGINLQRNVTATFFNANLNGYQNVMNIAGGDSRVTMINSYLMTRMPNASYVNPASTLTLINTYYNISNMDMANVTVIDKNETDTFQSVVDRNSTLRGDKVILMGNFSINTTNGYIGIGTNNPLVPLDINTSNTDLGETAIRFSTTNGGTASVVFSQSLWNDPDVNAFTVTSVPGSGSAFNFCGGSNALAGCTSFTVYIAANTSTKTDQNQVLGANYYGLAVSDVPTSRPVAGLSGDQDWLISSKAIRYPNVGMTIANGNYTSEDANNVSYGVQFSRTRLTTTTSDGGELRFGKETNWTTTAATRSSRLWLMLMNQNTKYPILWGTSNGTIGIGFNVRQPNASYGLDVQTKGIRTNGSNWLGGDTEIIGNLTANTIYGGMWNYTDLGFNITPLGVGVYTNVSGLEKGDANGVDFEDSIGLRVLISGEYRIEAQLSATFGNNGEYGFCASINSGNCEIYPNNKCYIRLTGTARVEGQSITCLRKLTAGDLVTLMFDDEANPVQNILVQTANLNIVRVGS